MVFGIDNGYHYTKDSDMHLFTSAVSRVDTSLRGDNKITIDGVNYYFGRGETTVNIDKIDSTINQVCTLACIAMHGNGDYQLVVGLPIAQFHSKKERFQQTVLSYNECEVVYNNKVINFHISDVTVFAQGAGVLFNYPIPDGAYIILDVGSYTINVVLVELKSGIPQILKYDTWYNGILNLYGTIINQVNQKFDTTLDMMEAEHILRNGLYVKGFMQDTSFLEAIKQEYLNDILTKFKLRYNYATTPILICGGGGSLLQELISNEFYNSILMPNSQFANATGYRNFGLQKYGES